MDLPAKLLKKTTLQRSTMFAPDFCNKMIFQTITTEQCHFCTNMIYHTSTTELCHFCYHQLKEGGIWMPDIALEHVTIAPRLHFSSRVMVTSVTCLHFSTINLANQS